MSVPVTTTRLTAYVAVLFVAALTFAIYAPALEHMLFYDDPLSIVANMLPRSLFGVFAPSGWEYRPIPWFLWNLVRDALGWYVHAPIHFWNVGAHVLCTVLVANLSGQLAGRLTWRNPWLAALSALMFGLYPLSFQAVIWSGAIYHPAKSLFGLLGLHAYLAWRRSRIRWWLSLALLYAACLSHETGFVFGILVLALELGLARAMHRSINPGSLALAGCVLVYPLIYRLFFGTYWANLVNQNEAGFRPMLEELPVEAAYFLQAFNAWLVILVRPIIGLIEPRQLPVEALGLGVLPIVAGLAVLWLNRQMTFGLIGLSFWLVDATLASTLLDANYILGSPRLTYVGAIGVGLFWSAVIVSGFHLLRMKLPRLASLGIGGIGGGIIIALSIWSAQYLRLHMHDVSGLTSGMKQLDADLRTLPETASVVLINLPHWSAPAYPAFLFGAEGDVIYIYGPSEWVGGIGGQYRKVTALRDDTAFVGNPTYHYQLAGSPVDDGTIHRAILDADLVYRVEFNGPRLHLRRLAQLYRASPDEPPLARFRRDEELIELYQAQATLQRDGWLALELVWAVRTPPNVPTGVLIHGFDAEGRYMLNADRDLIEGYLPITLVPPGLRIREHRRIVLHDRERIPATMAIGLYDRDTVTRYRATRDDGTRWADDVVVVTVR